MKDIDLDGLNNIKADKKLIEKTVNKVMNNSRSKNYFSIKKSIAVAAVLMMMIAGSASAYSVYGNGDLEKVIANIIVTDSKVASNKTDTDSKVTPDKAVADGKHTPTKTVADGKVTPDKAVADGKDTPTKTVTDTKQIPDKVVVDGKETPDKTVVDGKGTADKTVVDGNQPQDKTVTDNKGTPDKAVVDSKATPNKTVAAANAISIPAITLNPKNAVHAKMFALVVYKGKIYIESNTHLDSENPKNFLGEKIGRTINSIDEWNVKDKSSEELSSNIGEQDVYTVKGYDDSFRIMSYSKTESEEYAQLFDCLNGITVKSGEDIFGKLNLAGNIESAKFRTFDDWNNGTNNYINFKSMNVLNEVLKDFNNAVPYNYETVEKDIDSSRSNNEFREFTLKLKNGLELKLTAFKKGYVSYGNSNIYFKVEGSVIDKLWQ